MTQRADSSRAPRYPRAARVLMAGLILSLTLTAGFAKAFQDEDAAGALSPIRAHTMGHVAVGALFAPLFNAVAARRARFNAHAAHAARNDPAASQLTYGWAAPPPPILPISP